MLLPRLIPLAALLLAAPLAGQDELPRQIILQPAEVTVENFLDSIALTVEWPGPDADQVAREEAAVAAMERIADILDACGCVDGGGTSVPVRIGQGALVAVALWMAISLSKIAGKDETDIHNEGDVNVTVEPHEHDEPPSDDDDHGEGS